MIPGLMHGESRGTHRRPGACRALFASFVRCLRQLQVGTMADAPEPSSEAGKAAGHVRAAGWVACSSWENVLQPARRAFLVFPASYRVYRGHRQPTAVLEGARLAVDATLVSA